MNRIEPKVNVIITTCNRPHFLLQAITSVRKQSYSNYDLTVVNDGKALDQGELERVFGGRLAYLHTEGKGTAFGRNQGAWATRGKYLAILDDDDVWHPDKLRHQTEIMESAEESVALCHGLVEYVDENLVVDRHWKRRLPRLYRVAASGGESYENYLNKSLIFTSATLIRRSAFDTIGGYDTDLRSREDLDLYLRLLMKDFRFTFLPGSPVMLYRRHAGNTNMQVAWRGLVAIYTKHLDWYSSPQGAVEKRRQKLLIINLACCYHGMNHYGISIKTWLKCLKLYPESIFCYRLWRSMLAMSVKGFGLFLKAFYRSVFSRLRGGPV